jgi:hypothetical protein
MALHKIKASLSGSLWHNFSVSSYRVKVHISGQHDFEAEGDKATVERQFSIFTELVRSVMSKHSNNGPAVGILPESLARIVRTDDKSIFLSTVPATSCPAADALLLLLLAYKMISNQDVVGGKQLLDSLKRSGVDTQRIDRALGRYLGGTQALVIKMGIRRGVKYKLTERGISKAKELSGNLQ